MTQGILKALALISTVFAAGCAEFPPNPDFETVTRNPTSLPRATITTFNESLVCMDTLLDVNRKGPIVISSQGINNLTSDRSLSAGGKEMLITTIGQMTRRSGAVRFVAYGGDISDMLDLQGAHPNNASFVVPDYFIRGGVTQFNKSVWTGQAGAGGSVEFDRTIIDDGDGDAGSNIETEDATGSFSRLGGLGSVTMDLSMGRIADLQILPHVYSANTLALRNSRGTAITGDIAVADVGVSFSYTNSVNEDFNDLFRALIQVGTIELIGKLFDVPYWQCLANAGDNQERTRALLEEWEQIDASGDPAKVLIGQFALARSGYYNGPADMSDSVRFRNALQRYQRDMNLLPTGLMDFDTFRMMNNFAPGISGNHVRWWVPSGPGQRVGSAPFGMALIEANG